MEQLLLFVNIADCILHCTQINLTQINLTQINLTQINLTQINSFDLGNVLMEIISAFATIARGAHEK